MSKETNSIIRLSQAAKKFNVGKDTIVEFLAKKGFQVDSSPNTRLTQEMLTLLIMEYQGENEERKEVRIKKKRRRIARQPENKNSVMSSEDHNMAAFVGKAKRIFDAGPIEGNAFLLLRYKIASEIIKYERFRKEYGIQEKGSSDTIYRLAKPFIEGYFTIAIVGKTSAEKYSFINSLIGEPLFPKSKNQTISTFIVIENGSEAKMEVLFCDGHTENMEYDIVKIKEMLKLIVSVPEEYSKLPISQINQLIAEDSDIDIILEQKANIEKMAKKPEVDEELWRKYVNSHTKKDIPEKIMVSFPLPNEFDGWRIINTPDVSATGEIQEVTKMLFNERDNDNNKTVDAVVYLQDSSCSLEDDSTHDSMEKVCNGLTEEAKDRLFFVLAQATREQSIGSEDFIIEKKKTLQKAQELYSDILNIPQDRFICIDILLERFNNEVKDKVNFGILPCPSNWDVEEWNSMANIYTQIEIQIKRNEFQPCGESFGKITKEWSGFDDLKLLLDEFVRKEKSDIYDNICTCIKKDLDSFEKPLS